MPQNNNTLERRIRESWRMHACAAGLCAGTQIFLLGTGIALPLCGNSVWIASLASVPSCAAAAALARRSLSRKTIRRVGYGALALSCLLLAVFACAALCAVAANALLPLSRALSVAALTAVFVLLCAHSGTGTVRLCFLLRRALPVLLLVPAFISMPDAKLHGVFPLLGRGAGRLAAAAAMMAAGAAPVFALMIPPRELDNHPSAKEYLPRAGYFALTAAAGAAAGCILLFALCAGNTPAALNREPLWGSRLLLLSGGMHQGIFDTLLILSTTASCVLYAAHMLASGEAAIIRLFPEAKKRPVAAPSSGLSDRHKIFCARSKILCTISDHAKNARMALMAEGAALISALFAFAALGDTLSPALGLLAAPFALLSLTPGGRKEESA